MVKKVFRFKAIALGLMMAGFGSAHAGELNFYGFEGVKCTDKYTCNQTGNVQAVKKKMNLVNKVKDPSVYKKKTSHVHEHVKKSKTVKQVVEKKKNILKPLKESASALANDDLEESKFTKNVFYIYKGESISSALKRWVENFDKVYEVFYIGEKMFFFNHAYEIWAKTPTEALKKVYYADGNFKMKFILKIGEDGSIILISRDELEKARDTLRRIK